MEAIATIPACPGRISSRGRVNKYDGIHVAAAGGLQRRREREIDGLMKTRGIRLSDVVEQVSGVSQARIASEEYP